MLYLCIMQVSIQEYVHTRGYTNTHRYILNEIISLGMTVPSPRNPILIKTTAPGIRNLHLHCS